MFEKTNIIKNKDNKNNINSQSISQLSVSNSNIF